MIHRSVFKKFRTCYNYFYQRNEQENPPTAGLFTGCIILLHKARGTWVSRRKAGGSKTQGSGMGHGFCKISPHWDIIVVHVPLIKCTYQLYYLVLTKFNN